jgi:hypothetical protein
MSRLFLFAIITLGALPHVACVTHKTAADGSSYSKVQLGPFKVIVDKEAPAATAAKSAATTPAEPKNTSPTPPASADAK